MARNVGARAAARTGRRKGGQIWAVNVTPLVTAAQEGTAHAARTARRERARARQRQWWRQRWVMVTAAGLVVAGAAVGGYAAMAQRRKQGAHTDSTGESQPGPIKSTVEAGRAKVAEATRTVLHKLRSNGAVGPRLDQPPEQPDQREQVPTVGTGY